MPLTGCCAHPGVRPAFEALLFCYSIDPGITRNFSILKPINLEKMPYSTSLRSKRLRLLAVTVLIVACTKAFPAQNYFHSTPSGSHIFGNYPLYMYSGDTALLNNGDRSGVAVREARDPASAGFIHRERNGDLVIAIPNVAREKYKIRFFDDDNHFLFEVRQIRDPLLIVEKYNFQHAGMFHYELYRESLLIERSSFLIRKD